MMAMIVPFRTMIPRYLYVYNCFNQQLNLSAYLYNHTTMLGYIQLQNHEIFMLFRTFTASLKSVDIWDHSKDNKSKVS